MTSQRPKPNLFKYGRKELSQDAMICWLLAWADECHAATCPALHQAGQSLVKALFRKHDRPGPERICTVKLEQQASGIDVLAWINDEYALLIEDKTDSHEHSGQLGRYHKRVLDGEAWVGCKPIKPSEDRFFPIFLKTGNMPRREKNSIEEGKKLDPPYRVFERGDFLKVLRDCDQNASEILSDFRRYLEERFESWRDKRLTEWSGEDWQGFYHSLEEKLDPKGENVQNMGWAYVNPPGGDGFWGFWWYPDPEGADLYLQAKRNELHFKIEVEHREKRRECRWHWHERIMQAGESARMPVVKPARFGSGKTMTVAILEGDWRRSGSDGRLDLEKTVEVLKKAERVLQAAVSKDSRE